jgi:hypothetical protein
VFDEPFTGINVTARTLIETMFVEHLVAGGMIAMMHHGDLENTEFAHYLQEVRLRRPLAGSLKTNYSYGSEIVAILCIPCFFSYCYRLYFLIVCFRSQTGSPKENPYINKGIS